MSPVMVGRREGGRRERGEGGRKKGEGEGDRENSMVYSVCVCSPVQCTCSHWCVHYAYIHIVGYYVTDLAIGIIRRVKALQKLSICISFSPFAICYFWMLFNIVYTVCVCVCGEY